MSEVACDTTTFIGTQLAEPLKLYLANSTKKAAQSIRNKFFYKFLFTFGFMSRLSEYSWFDIGQDYPTAPVKGGRTVYEKEHIVRLDAAQMVQHHMCPAGQRTVIKQLVASCGESVVYTSHIVVESSNGVVDVIRKVENEGN